MKRWFESLPIHRKLVMLGLGVSAGALLAAVIGLLVFDIARFRTSAFDDADALARVIAENTAAAILFDDSEAANETLASVRVRPVVLRACVYRENGTLLAGYETSADSPCPTKPSDQRSWQAVASEVPVVRNAHVVGTVYVERSLSDLGPRIGATAVAGTLMLVVAGVTAFGLAEWLQRTISGPIVELAAAARAIGRDQTFEIPPIVAPPDETGELVRAFGDMVRRVGEANAELVSANDTLRTEVDQRRRMQAEREDLLAREREASRLKDEFLAALSHELRTPLNAILGWTQILTSTSPDEPTMGKAIASLSRNAHAQKRVVEDLLDISRIITGKLQLTLTAVDLRSVIDSAMEVIEPIAVAKNIHLEATLPAAPCMVQADNDRMRQILWNLLSNAVKFTPAGGAVTVHMSTGPGVFRVSVTDTGIGISPLFLAHVFERFRQADGSTTREHGGLGLGLAIVKELTELHGGSVDASSEGPGKGAMFSMTVPQLAERLSRGEEMAARGSGPVPRLDGISVLAVDDNLDALDIATVALTDVGAAVRVAASGHEALSLWQQQPADVLLCDLAMPHMDGFEVLDGIRRLDLASGHRTLALAVTAYVSDEYQARCLRAGFQGHVAKPYNTADLIRSVRSAVDRA